MAIDTAAKRAASLHYGRPGTAGTTVPSASSTAFKRGTTLGLYPKIDEIGITTAEKRAASLHYGRPGTAGTTIPSASSTFFKRGATLGLYPNEAGPIEPTATKKYSLFNPVVLRSAR